METKLHRVDYLQVGLTNKNTLRIIDSVTYENGQIVAVTAVVGDQSGSLHCFGIRSDSSHVETIHQTPPEANSMVNCLEIVGGTTGSSKVLAAMGALNIKGYTRKGKNFFGLELNNLTEPIKHLKLRWPSDIFICSHYVFNHYVINADNSSGEKGTIVQSKNFYVCPEIITGMLLVDDKTKRKTVAVLAAKDRLIRVIRDSTCEFEIETSGIPSALIMIPTPGKRQECYFCYGCSDGKVSLIGVDFSKKPNVPKHHWEIPERGSKAPVECISCNESGDEIVIGRSDGSIELWTFSANMAPDGTGEVNFESSPVLTSTFNCPESITSVSMTKDGFLILCCTFTGIIFGLTRQDFAGQKLNPNYLVIGKDNIMKIEKLRAECDELEMKLADERAQYQEMTNSNATTKKGKGQTQQVGVSALPCFALNDSFILQEDAAYLLAIEIEVAIDAIIVQSDIPLDLIDCEKNSAVVSYSETNSPEVLATFRCQSNTTRLEIKIRSVEGQYGLLRIYVMTRMTPKSCQVKHYTIKPLSLHKRSYTADTSDFKSFLNTLTITGNFSMNEGHNWIEKCMPEVPERVAPGQPSVNYGFTSTICGTMLNCELARGALTFHSDNVSTISIVKDFIAREATKKSVLIEMAVDPNESSLGHTLRKLYPKLVALVQKKHNDRLREAIKEVNATDPEVAANMLEDLKRDESTLDASLSTLNLERLYGLITDLFIDHHKLRGSASRQTLNSIRSKIGDLILLVDTSVTEKVSADTFVDRINDFWGVKQN